MKSQTRIVLFALAALLCFAAGVGVGTHAQRLYGFFFTRSRRVTFAGSRGALEGRIYYPRRIGSRDYPGILFCHGMLPKGKSAKAYSRLMQLLARRGYLVMGFDLHGFGESSKAAAHLALPRDLDFVADVRDALDFMTRRLPVDPGTLAVAGHSMGANLAFAVGASSPRVRNIILISPGNYRIDDRYPEGMKIFFARKLGQAINREITVEDWDRIEKPLALAQYVPLAQPKRVLFILADGEAEGMLPYSRTVYDELNARKKLVVLPDCNHTLGYDDFTGSELIDPRPERLIAAAIDSWLRGTGEK
jgi:pimeloyl-ACP methyl ester carboxylesterase